MRCGDVKQIHGLNETITEPPLHCYIH